MSYIYVLFSLIIAVLNIVFLKMYKRKCGFLIASSVLNIVFIVVNMISCTYTVESFFDVVYLNFLMWFAICDIIEREMITLPFCVFAVIGIAASFFVEGSSFILIIIYSIAIFGILYLFSKKSNEGIGMADVYAISITSLFNATYNTTSIVIVSLIFSLIFGLVMAGRNKSGNKTLIPYIPFLFATSYLFEFLYRI